MAKIIVELIPEDLHPVFQDSGWTTNPTYISSLDFYHFKDDLRDLLQKATQIFYVCNNKKYKIK